MNFKIKMALMSMALFLAPSGDAVAQPKYPDIWEATRTGNIEAAKFRLRYMKNVNLKRGGRTLLHVAVSWYVQAPMDSGGGGWQDNHEIVELLLEKGVKPNVKDSDGETPLHLAVKRGMNKTVEFLIQHGADIYILNGKKDTPFDYAMSSKDDAPLRLMRNNIPLRLTIKSDCGIKIALHGVPGQAFLLMRSTDLRNWRLLDVGVLQFKTDVFTDHDNLHRQSFYRVEPVF